MGIILLRGFVLGSHTEENLRNELFVREGGPEVLLQRLSSSSCFPRAVLTEGFATTHEAWQLLFTFLELPEISQPPADLLFTKRSFFSMSTGHGRA